MWKRSVLSAGTAGEAPKKFQVELQHPRGLAICRADLHLPAVCLYPSPVDTLDVRGWGIKTHQGWLNALPSIAVIINVCENLCAVFTACSFVVKKHAL